MRNASCQLVPCQPLVLERQREVDQVERHRGQQRTDQQPVSGHQPALDEAAPHRLLQQVAGDRPESEEQQIGDADLEPAVDRSVQGAGGQGNASGQQRHRPDQQQVAPTQPPAEQTRKQLPDAASSVGGPGDRRGQADQDEEFGQLRRHQVDTGHRRRHLGEPHEGDGRTQQQQDRMGDRRP